MPRRLLVADDALIIRQIIKEMATSAGWEKGKSHLLSGGCLHLRNPDDV